MSMAKQSSRIKSLAGLYRRLHDSLALMTARHCHECPGTVGLHAEMNYRSIHYIYMPCSMAYRSVTEGRPQGKARHNGKVMLYILAGAEGLLR